jgi:hypothetical protein
LAKKRANDESALASFAFDIDDSDRRLANLLSRLILCSLASCALTLQGRCLGAPLRNVGRRAKALSPPLKFVFPVHFSRQKEQMMMVC